MSIKRTTVRLLGRRTCLGTLALVCSTQACRDGSSSSQDAAATDGTGGKAPAGPLGLFCSPGVDPTDPLIADFSAATFNGNGGRWGGDLNLTLFVYDYHDPNSESSNTLDREAFTFSGQVVPGTPAGYAGGGIHFDSCLDTTTYQGVQFKLTGSAGGCTIYFELQTYSQEPINERGGCSTYCFHFPRIAVTPHSTPVVVSFASLEGTGIPSGAAAMASEIMGLRWQLELPPGPVDAAATACAFSITIDDVKLVM